MNFRCTLPLLRLPSGKQRRANYVAARRDAGLNERQAAVTLQRHIVLALEFLSPPPHLALPRSRQHLRAQP
jgi:hypothetical protein